MNPRLSAKATVHEELSEIREDAAYWIVSLDEAGPEEYERLHAECEAWQAGDPCRRRVFAQMRQMWSAMRPVPKAGRGRRRAIVAGTFLLAAVAVAQLPWKVWTADHRTAAGEIRDVTLPDGSTAVLNSRSAIDVAYDGGQRTIRLEDGEVMVTVRQDPTARPFSVAVPDGTATALGTRYSVRREDGHSVVSVHESLVSLTPRASVEPPVVLAAGQRARLSASGVSGLQPTDGRTPGWVDGRLVFNDTPLADVVDRLRRYRRGWLALSNELADSDRRFTGVLPADDSDAALALLASAMSLEVRRFTPYFVRLQRRR